MTFTQNLNKIITRVDLDQDSSASMLTDIFSGNINIKDTISTAVIQPGALKSGMFEFIKLYPNPSDGIIHLELDEKFQGKVSISITDVTGRMVFNKEYNSVSELLSIDLEHLQSGNYILTSSLVTGGAFSLDGVHPTARGYALLANEFLKSIDATYGSNFEEDNLYTTKE